MHFRLKIFAATLIILLATLVLNSVLSISSFERMYSRSLISIMESAAVSLKQDIERGILLGKPLDAFEGMDKMLSDFLQSSPRVDNVGVSIGAGDIIYFQGDEKDGLALLARHGREHYGQIEPRHSFAHNTHLIYIPVFHRAAQEPLGAVLLSFSQAVILERISEMAGGALLRLGWSLGLTALLLILLLFLFVVRPVRKDLERIRQALLPFIREDAGAPGAAKDLETEKQQYPGRTAQDSPGSRQEHVPDIPGYSALVHRFPDSRKIRNDIVSLGAYLQEIALELGSREQQPGDDLKLGAQEIIAGLEECNLELAWYLGRKQVSLDQENELQTLLKDNQLAIEALKKLKGLSSAGSAADKHARPEKVTGGSE